MKKSPVAMWMEVCSGGSNHNWTLPPIWLNLTFPTLVVLQMYAVCSFLLFFLSISPEVFQNPPKLSDLTCSISTKYINIMNHFLINKTQYTALGKRNLEMTRHSRLISQLPFHGGQWVEFLVLLHMVKIPETLGHRSHSFPNFYGPYPCKQSSLWLLFFAWEW
jgi:hypothetical protein